MKYRRGKVIIMFKSIRGSVVKWEERKEVCVKIVGESREGKRSVTKGIITVSWNN